MKPKKFSKKLTLNKSTVAYLNGNELKQVKGGKPDVFTYPGEPCLTTLGYPCTSNYPWICCQ